MRPNTVPMICPECGKRWKLPKVHPEFRRRRIQRRKGGPFPRGLCPDCAEKEKMRQHDHTTGSKAKANQYRENAKSSPRNFRIRRAKRPWAWRELDD